MTNFVGPPTLEDLALWRIYPTSAHARRRYTLQEAAPHD